MKTFSSAVLCSCGGTVIAEDPLDLTRDAVWRCQECDDTIQALQVKLKIENKISHILDD